MCHQLLGAGAWAWMSGQASVFCSAVLCCDSSTLLELLFASEKANHNSSFAEEFGHRIPGHSLLQGRVGKNVCMEAQMRRYTCEQKMLCSGIDPC